MDKRERHPLWYEELVKRKSAVNECKEFKEEKDVTFKDESLEILKEAKMASLKVLGMSCEHCVRSVKKKLEELEGIQSVEVSLEKGEVYFENKRALPMEIIKKAIEEAGYQVSEDKKL